MMVMNYDGAAGGWGEPEIVPFEDFSVNPACSSLHYGQGIFEGLKAYKNSKGEVTMFRPRDNFVRMNRSAERLCMPTFDSDVALNALVELVKLEEEWIPTLPGTALYIRPFMFGTEPFLGVHPSHRYTLCIILSPVGSYYEHGLEPTKLIVETELTRASKGGTGEAKCMGNYACSLLAGERAKQKGYDQVLWLDGAEKKYVEEVGAMNMFFVIDGTVVTPMLDGSILRGITRDSALTVLRAHGYKVEERHVPIAEVVEAYKNGKLDEAFGSGTAAVVAKKLGRKYFGMRPVMVGFDNRKNGLLYCGSQAQVEEETRRIIEMYRRTFGSTDTLILGADCSFLTDFSPERFRWVLDTAKACS